MLEPRKTFRENPALMKGWQDLVDSRQFRAAAETAMLEMQFGLPPGTEMGVAAANYSKMAGAKEFLRILMALAEPDPAGIAKIAQNLQRTK